MGKRENWYIKNISDRQIGLGDLPRIPVLSPKQSIDALGFYSKSDVQQSVHLVTAVKKGWLQLTKIVDGEREVVSASEIEEETRSADRSDVANGSGSGKAIATLLTTLEDEGTIGEIGFLDGVFYGFNGSEWISLAGAWSNLGA